MIYTITFNPALDCTFYSSSITLGTLNRISRSQVSAGGKGINVSLVLSNLGVPNTALGFVGGFTGAEITRQLNVAKCNTDFVNVKSGDSRINVKINADTKTELNVEGPTISSDELADFLYKLDKVVDGDYVVLSGSIPKGLTPAVYGQILDALVGKKVNIVVDTSGELLKQCLEYQPFLVKPNRYELGELFDVEIESDEDVIKYASFLQDVGAQNVLVSMDKDGAILLDETGTVHRLVAPEITKVNTVGAGDSMVAGFLASYIKDGDYANALKYSVACGTATSSTEGLATLDIVNMYL